MRLENSGEFLSRVQLLYRREKSFQLLGMVCIIIDVYGLFSLYDVFKPTFHPAERRQCTDNFSGGDFEQPSDYGCCNSIFDIVPPRHTEAYICQFHPVIYEIKIK